jgi:hypothetical protein
MKLKPRQVIGLVAIVVFGGAMIFRMTQPSEREIMEQRLASLPSVSQSLDTTVEFPAMAPVEIPALTGPAAPALGDGTAGGDDRPIWELSGIDHHALGSQAAKDDLYCGGVLSAEFDAIKATAHPDQMSMLLRDSQALDGAGVAKLKAEGHATDSTWAGFSLAWGDKALKDYQAGTLRLSVADCTARAAALK